MGLVSTWVSSTDVVGVKGWTGVKGVRDAKESCEVGCEMVSRRSGCRSRSGSLNGGVSYKACHRRRAMSPCPVVGASVLLRVYLQWFQ